MCTATYSPRVEVLDPDSSMNRKICSYLDNATEIMVLQRHNTFKHILKQHIYPELSSSQKKVLKGRLSSVNSNGYITSEAKSAFASFGIALEQCKLSEVGKKIPCEPTLSDTQVCLQVLVSRFNRLNENERMTNKITFSACTLTEDNYLQAFERFCQSITFSDEKAIILRFKGKEMSCLPDLSAFCKNNKCKISLHLRNMPTLKAISNLKEQKYQSLRIVNTGIVNLNGLALTAIPGTVYINSPGNLPFFKKDPTPVRL